MHQFHWHWHFWHQARKKELNEIYMSIAIRSLALSLVGIFVPLYLYKELSFSLPQIMIFYLAILLSFSFFTIPAAKLIKKIGVKHVMLTSMPIMVCFFLLLHFLPYFKGLYPLVGILGGLTDALFWLAFHYNFIKSSDKKHRGKEVGTWFSVSLIAGVAGPFLGGIILTLFQGFTTLFIIISVLLLSSTLPLFMSKDKGKKASYNLKHLFTHLNFKEIVSLAAYGFRGYTAGILWPIFIFVILKSYLNLGSLASAVALVGAIVVFIAGKLGDKYGKKHFIKLGAFISGTVWFFRFFVRTIGQVFGAATIGDIAFAVNDVCYNAKIYDRAAKKNTMEYLIYREWALCLGRFLTVITVLLLAKFFSEKVIYSSTFFMSGLASFIWTII